jgi:peroxiredoxin
MTKDFVHALRNVVVAAGASVVVLGAAGCGGDLDNERGAASAADASSLLGNPAPEFRVKPVVGAKAPVSLKGLRGRVVLIDFWGTFCEPCKKSFPKLQELHTRYAASGLQIVGISEDEAEDKDKIPGFADSLGAHFPLAWDEDKSIAKAYKPETMPSSFLVDKKGIVRYAHAGYHDGEEARLEKEIEGLLRQ